MQVFTLSCINERENNRERGVRGRETGEEDGRQKKGWCEKSSGSDRGEEGEERGGVSEREMRDGRDRREISSLESCTVYLRK